MRTIGTVYGVLDKKVCRPYHKGHGHPLLPWLFYFSFPSRCFLCALCVSVVNPPVREWLRRITPCVGRFLWKIPVLVCGMGVLWAACTEPGFCLSEKDPPAAEAPGSPKVGERSKPTDSRVGPRQADPSRFEELFDGRTLAGWKVLDELAFKTHGKVEVREGEILLGRGEPFTGIRWTGAFPRSNYEVLIEARRVEGDDFFCGVVFPVGQADCSLVVGGWGGSIVGLSNIDGEPAAENETAASMDFTKGRWYAIRLRVSDQKIRLWIDQEKIIDFAHPDRKLSIRWDQEPMRPFGICTWQTTGAVRKVSLCRVPQEAPPQQEIQKGSNASPLPDAQAPSSTFAVPKTFDGQPCTCQVRLQHQEEGFRVYGWRYPSPVRTPVDENNTIPAEYYLPDGACEGPPRPAVIVLHILHGDYALERLLCRTLALRGIPAVMFKLPYYGERGIEGGRDAVVRNPSLFVEALPQAIADCRRTIDVLGARAEVDPTKISLAGISLGGVIGATAAASDTRVHRAALILAGGDVLTIVNQCRETRQLRQFLQSLPPDRRQTMEKAIEQVDPLRHAPGLRDRALAGRVLMVNAAEDEVIPRVCTEKLAQALGIADRVVWLEGLGHYTAIAALPQTLQRTVAFFAEDLPPQVKPPVLQQPASDSPDRMILHVVQQLLAMLLKEPAERQCHLVDISAEVVDPAGKKYDGRVRWIRGHDYRFRLELKISGFPEAALGQGDWPWLASANRVFVGRVQEGSQRMDPLRFVHPRHLTRVKTWTAALTGLLQMPRLLDSLVEMQEIKPDASSENTLPKEREAGGTEPARLLQIWQKGKKENTLRIWLQKDGRPSRAEMALDKFQGKISVHAWQLNSPAPEPLFEPPGRPVQEVSPEDLVRIWSSIFEFLMEKTE